MTEYTYTDIVTEPRWINVAVTPELENGHMMCVIASVLVTPEHDAFKPAAELLAKKCHAVISQYGAKDEDWMFGAFVVTLYAMYNVCPGEDPHYCLHKPPHTIFDSMDEAPTPFDR